VQYVTEEQFLGALLHANDELVTALMTFEQLDRSLDADSDSEDEMAEQRHAYKGTYSQHALMFRSNIPPVLSEKVRANTGDEALAQTQLAGLQISPPKSSSPEKQPPQPPRPVVSTTPQYNEADDEDENDPFGDSHALQTPAVEKDEPRW
jgi:hypothetical protein